MRINYYFCASWILLLSGFLGVRQSASAQCPATHLAIDALDRTGGNTVTYDVGTETIGTYADQWQNYVDFTESIGATAIHSNAGT
jgi:hypothetical protein